MSLEEMVPKGEVVKVSRKGLMEEIKKKEDWVVNENMHLSYERFLVRAVIKEPEGLAYGRITNDTRICVQTEVYQKIELIYDDEIEMKEKKKESMSNFFKI